MTFSEGEKHLRAVDPKDMRIEKKEQAQIVLTEFKSRLKPLAIKVSERSEAIQMRFHILVADIRDRRFKLSRPQRTFRSEAEISSRFFHPTTMGPVDSSSDTSKPTITTLFDNGKTPKR